MSDLREKFRKEEGITWYVDPELRGNPKYFRKQYVEWLEQRLEAGQHDTLVSVPELRNKLSPVSNLIAILEEDYVFVGFKNGKGRDIFNSELDKVKNILKELAH